MSRQTPEHTPPHPATTGIIFLTVGEKQEQEQKNKTLNSDTYTS